MQKISPRLSLCRRRVERAKKTSNSKRNLLSPNAIADCAKDRKTPAVKNVKVGKLKDEKNFPLRLEIEESSFLEFASDISKLSPRGTNARVNVLFARALDLPNNFFSSTSF